MLIEQIKVMIITLFYQRNHNKDCITIHSKHSLNLVNKSLISFGFPSHVTRPLTERSLRNRSIEKIHNPVVIRRKRERERWKSGVTVEIAALQKQKG